MKTYILVTIVALTPLTAVTPARSESPVLPVPAASAGYTLHEWGTFTSVSGSDGKLLPGVHLEEPLPRFVHAHQGMEPGAVRDNRWVRPLAGVTVRLETPVIYFYTENPFEAHVDVQFKGGSISQWFPQRSGGEKAPGTNLIATKGLAIPDRERNQLDFARGYAGSITWDVNVEPASEDAMARVFRSGETPSWIFPRHTDSALVTNRESETEKYLFYRGVGNFQPPVVFTSSDTGQVAMRNTGAATIPGFLAFELDNASSARWSVVRGIAPATSAQVAMGQRPFGRDWRKSLYADAVQLLLDAGLYRKEADAMLQTWWPSYFERPGFRVFWVMPRETTDAILPLTVSPPPQKTVRVMVGRTEILSPVFERVLVDSFADAQNNPWLTDRFAPAFAARVTQLTSSTARAVPASVPAPVPPAAAR